MIVAVVRSCLSISSSHLYGHATVSFNCSPLEGHLDWLEFGAVTNKATVIVCVEALDDIEKRP